MSGRLGRALVGVDGCPAGWIAVLRMGDALHPLLVGSMRELVERVPEDALIAVDVPIGLMDRGARECDLTARRMLAPVRSSSVFPAPIRPVLTARSYTEACETRARIEGKRMSQQSFAIVSKIREVDELLQVERGLRERIKEVHPELSFALWNGGTPMLAAKKKAPGKAEREALIEAWRPGAHAAFLGRWPRSQVGRDDLTDAFAALWTAGRMVASTAVRIPSADPPRDATGLAMEMWA